jgi:glycerol-3-phosphate acyltransferase PlsY
MKIIISIIIAYLLGSIPSGFILGKTFKGIDIREYGSKNIGATNVIRVIGVIPGIISFILDFFKGFFAVQIGRWLLESQSSSFQILIACVGIAAILGHILPIFLHFKGGKGVATGAGVFVNIIPYPTLFATIAFAIILLIFRIVSLASLIAVITLFVSEMIMNIPEFQEIPFLILTGIMMFLIIIRHKANIKRLKNGREKKLW